MALPLEVAAYLNRIGFSGPALPRIDTLRRLHRAHLLTVPFENLDIALGREILCDQPRILHKIVELRRGGFCYELNGAFAALLQALGFTVTLLSARVPLPDGSDGPEFDHLAIRVDLAEPWLADVGFGDFILEPLRLELGIEQPQHGRTWRIVPRDPPAAANAPQDERLVVQRQEPGGTWNVQYDFTLRPRNLDQFAGMCRYHQTSPDSPFTRKRVCSRATSAGRITLSDRKLITTRGAARDERLLQSEEECAEVLKSHFGIVLRNSRTNKNGRLWACRCFSILVFAIQREILSPPFSPAYLLPIAVTRAFRRDLYRDAVFSCSTPFWIALSSAETVCR